MKKTNLIFGLATLLLCLILFLTAVGCVPEPGQLGNLQNGLNNGDLNSNNLQIQQFIDQPGTEDSSKPAESDLDIAPPQGKEGSEILKIVLYFGSSLNDRVERQIPATLGVGRAAINQLIAGPQLGENKKKVIPDGTVLRSIRFVGDTIEADFSRELKDNHWGGIYEEYRTVYSIVNTLTEFPQVKQVQILLEGEKIKSIAAGYLDLTEPLSRNTEINEDVISSRYLQQSREKSELRVVEWDKFMRDEAAQKKQITNGQVISAVTGQISGNGAKELVLSFKDQVEVWQFDRNSYRKIDQLATPDGPRRALIKDLTGDGKGELILFDSTNLNIYSWTGEKFEQQWWQGPVGGEIVNLYVGDADLDGLKELVILRKRVQEEDTAKFINTIEIWQYNGSSFIKKMKTSEFPFYNLLVEQIKPNQAANIIGIGKSGLAGFIWNGQVYVERFGSPVIKGQVTVGDVDGNGFQNLICLDELGMDVYFYELTSLGLRKLWQTGNLTGGRLAKIVAVADWDNDGCTETIIATNAEGGYLIYYPEDGEFRNYSFREGDGRILLVDDLDGDGQQEILINYGKSAASPGVYVLRLNKSLLTE